ncbi:MAG: TetR/AcrR family transcriptional regulator [Anaerolineae bacterium]|nr:TetR/AcrR family transcriptional regulator [Gemmatimonadaceae bacterium]
MTDEKESRERILDAAHTIFLRRGTASARTQEIADEAGVNKALLHYYFGSKEALAEEIFRRAIGDFFPRFFAILGSGLSLDEKVPLVVETYLDFLSSRPYLPGYVVSEMHVHPDRIRAVFASRGPAPLDVLTRQIEERVAAGTMRHIAVEQFVMNLVSLIVYPFVVRPAMEIVLQVDGDRFDAFISERRRTLPGFVLNALRP